MESTKKNQTVAPRKFKRQKTSEVFEPIEKKLPRVRHDSVVEDETPRTGNGDRAQYQGVHQSDAAYEAHLWNDSWDADITFSETNEEYMNYCTKEFSNAIDLEEPTGDLDNEILPLFARENWLLDGFVQDPDLVWSKLKPALQMASLFLTVPQVAWAFAPITMGRLAKWEGECEFLEHDEKEMLRQHDEDPEFLVRKFEDIRQKFASLTGKIRFTFATFGMINRWNASDAQTDFTIPDDYNWEVESGGQIHGITFNPGEPYLSDLFVRGNPLELQACQHLYRVFIHGAYAEFLQQDTSTCTPVRTTRTAFSLGVTLVHEVCHTLYCLERHPDISASAVHEDYNEPHLFKDTSCAEIGSAIERRLFGYPWQATIHPEEGASMDAMHAPCAWEAGEPVLGRAHFVHFIEPNWCYAFLTRKKWGEIRDIPLAESVRCCYWPTPFRAHARTKKPDILRWFEARKKGKNLAKMRQFDRDPQNDWEFVIRVGNFNADGSWDPGYGEEEWAEAVEAVETLDRDFLEWMVKETRKKRKKEEMVRSMKK